MKHQHKQKTIKNPPLPSDDPGLVTDWIKHIMPDLQLIAGTLDELINKNIPNLQYAIKWKKAFYGTPELGWIIEIVAYDISLNVVFHAGNQFRPAPPLGSAETSRYIKLKTISEANSPEVLDWIQQAKKHIGWIQ